MTISSFVRHFSWLLTVFPDKMFSLRQIIQQNTESKVAARLWNKQPELFNKTNSQCPSLPQGTWTLTLWAVTQHKEWSSPGEGVGLYRLCVFTLQVLHTAFALWKTNLAFSAILSFQNAPQLSLQRHNLKRKKHQVRGCLPKKLNYCCVQK